MTISVVTLELGVVSLPDWHPRSVDTTCLIQGYAVRHPDGVILFDTGTSDDHDYVNELYQPVITPIVEALNDIGVDERDVVAIVNSHLHFDHCGQNRSLPWAAVWAQADEYQLIDSPRYTISDWATVEPSRLRLISGDTDLAEGVRIISTPGHTPGHQSVLVQSHGVTTVIGGQCCYTCAEFETGSPAPEDVHDESWMAPARASIERLMSFDPDVVHLSHDRAIWSKQP
jgi:glyoxylase-like metal-dependent hydrolase (beta-lactamase superfamily II)